MPIVRDDLFKTTTCYFKHFGTSPNCARFGEVSFSNENSISYKSIGNKMNARKCKMFVKTTFPRMCLVTTKLDIFIITLTLIMLV